MTVINSNTSALLAQNANRMANSSLQNAMEQLSTGKRINTAADDAAGYAISAKMTSTERGMAVAIRNANDGVSMMQTANSALDSVTNMLQRMQELATQSANGTLGDSERASLQAENDQLVSQINDISKTTNFNGINLLDGSLKNLTLQVGTGSTDKVALNIGSASAGALGLTATQGVATGRVTAVTSYASGDLTLNGVDAFGGATYTQAATNKAVDLAAAINKASATTGAQATAYNTVTTSAVPSGTVATGSLQIAVGGGTAVSFGGSSAQDLVNNVNKANLGVTATLNDDNTITFANTTGQDINLSGSTGSFVSASIKKVNSGFVSLSSTSGSPLKVATSGSTGVESFVNNYDGQNLTGASFTAPSTSLPAGSTTINGVDIGAIASDATASTVADQINKVSAQTGVTASVSGGALSLTSADGSAIAITGGTNIGFVDSSDSHAQGSTLDISTQASASAALDTITKALDNVTSVAGKLGALENRMNVTIDNLTTASSNLEDARSRIQDADFSAETTSLAKAQILSQASTAMLAQANQSQQGVLKLLQ